MKRFILVAALLAMLAMPSFAQNTALTKEKVLSMSVDELSELPLEDLMYAVELLDVKSVDELFALVMNKNVSSASKKAEDSFKSPLSASVLTREEIRTFGCTTVEEALRMMTGMIVREKTNGNYDVHVRGLDNIPDANMLLYTENVNTLLMVNGRPVFNYSTGATMWEALPVGIEDIARIEVVRGPSSALYGSNAVTGVINIITEKPTVDSKLVQGSVQVGNYGSYTGDVAFRKAFNDKWAVSISANTQKRERPTRDIYLPPNSAIFDPADPTRDFSKGAYVSIKEMYDLRQIGGDGNVVNLTQNAAPVASLFPAPERSRQTIAANFALSYTPTPDITFDLTAGYQNSEAVTTTVGDFLFALNTHHSRQSYVDLTTNVKGLNLQMNYTTGPINYIVGTPGFKADNSQFTTNIDYDWTITDKFTIRPGFNFRWNQIDDTDYNQLFGIDKFGVKIRYPSTFDAAVTMRAFAPSIRIDYSPSEQLRFIAAYRAEKLNLPDEIYHSWQAAATFSPSENHNLRLIYSRANRSAIFINTSSNFTQMRYGAAFPDEVSFLGSPDSKVVWADNFELGYRLRPTEKILIDAEAYYNLSHDYGALMSESANFIMSIDNYFKFFEVAGASLMKLGAGLITPEQMNQEIMGETTKALVSRAYIQYTNLPYEVKQMGASVAADWIISNKLVAKFNFNVQKTTIDKYYTYSQTADIAAQFEQAAANMQGSATEFIQLMVNPTTLPWLTSENLDFKTGDPYRAEYEATLDEYGNRTESSDIMLSRFFNEKDFLVYYDLKYGTRVDLENGRSTFGRSRAHQPHTEENGYEHKNTPSFYGSIGLLYKPIESLSVAAHSYFYSKQTMKTQHGTAEIDGKFIMNLKVGYRPTEQFEVFFNGHNLFDNKKREFAYTDENRGIYSIGVSFSF